MRPSKQPFTHFLLRPLLMKVNILISIVLLAVIYLTCKNFQKVTPAEPAVTAAPTPDAPTGRALKVFGESSDSTDIIQFSEPPPHVDVPWEKIAKPSTSRRAFMSTGWWNPVGAIHPTDTTAQRHFKPKWLKFREDQTFDILIQNKVVDTGHWAFDETKFILYLSCNDPYFNNTWAIKERGFRMVLIGNTQENITGIQVRLDNRGELPAN
ncbi:MAG: hypothetical protein IT262_02175 [Saprospiraceae bacterium]|nr:hypothetical protein [Saprospiraceae bacterium]